MEQKKMVKKNKSEKMKKSLKTALKISKKSDLQNC